MGLVAALAIAGPARGQGQAQPPSSPQPATQQNQDSVADAARKAKDAANNGTTNGEAPKKVYTNEDLRRMDSSDVSVVGNTKGAGKAGQTASNDPKDEKYWHDRMQKLRDQMAQVDHQIAQIEGANQDQHSATSGSNPPPPPTSAYTVGAHAHGGNATQLEKLKERKAQIQQQMEQLEDEARRANVPPGWLR